MSPQRRLAVLALLTALVAQPAPAGAVIIRDDTWAANGGSKTRWSAGFGPAVALAAQAQFASVVSLGGCSGTWLGNDENDHAFVLTAAHCFVEVSASEKGATVVDENDPWIATTDEGTQLREIARTVHPRYDQTDEFAPGFDMAILEFDGPIEDCGDAPVLYSGSDEVGYAATLVGYGTRGTARHQEGEKFTADSDASKAAATNVVDAAVEAQATGPLGNDLQIDFDDPDGGSNALEGNGMPADALEGILGSGDSGGSLWIETDGGWRLAGVNSRSDNPEIAYGDINSFARISTQLDFIRTVFPDVLTGE